MRLSDSELQMTRSAKMSPSAPAEIAGYRSYTPLPWWVMVLRRLARNRAALISLCFLLLLLVPAFFAPQLVAADPLRMDSRALYQPPRAGHLLGTDHFGRDILSRILHGAKYSLRIGFISVTVSVIIGVPLGLFAGYYGRWLDDLVMRGVDIMLAFPGILLALVFVAILGPGLDNAILAVGVAAVPVYARLVRGSVLSAKQNDYILAARALGATDLRLIMRHLLPNVIGPVVVLATLGTATAIISGASLSFLGLGAQPPTPEWGAMLNDGRDYLRTAWWISTFPGLAIMVTVLAINLLGDGLQDALDPHRHQN